MNSTTCEQTLGTNAAAVAEDEEVCTVEVRLPYMGVTADENLGRVIEHLYDDDCEASYLTCTADDEVMVSVLFAGPEEYCFSVPLLEVVDGTLALAEDALVDERRDEAYTLRAMAASLRRQAERLEARAAELSA